MQHDAKRGRLSGKRPFLSRRHDSQQVAVGLLDTACACVEELVHIVDHLTPLLPVIRDDGDLAKQAPQLGS